MLKKTILFITILVLSISLFGCTCASEKNIISEWEICGTIEIKGDKDFAVYYDKTTKVMYVSNNVTGLSSVLLNADGTPMLYEDGEDNG